MNDFSVITSMLVPVRKGLFRWETPYPLNDQNLVGHLILKNETCIMIDPPCVPGLVDSVKKLGNSTMIILTSQNHTRGTSFIAEKTGATVYIPDQDERAVEPKELIAVKEIGNYEKYGEGEILGMRAFKDFYDFAILTEDKELIVSDNGRGTADGRLVLWPEGMDPPGPPNETIHKEFKSMVQKTGAVSLLAGHGFDIIGNLHELTNKL